MKPPSDLIGRHWRRRLAAACYCVGRSKGSGVSSPVQSSSTALAQRHAGGLVRASRTFCDFRE